MTPEQLRPILAQARRVWRMIDVFEPTRSAPDVLASVVAFTEVAWRDRWSAGIVPDALRNEFERVFLAYLHSKDEGTGTLDDRDQFLRAVVALGLEVVEREIERQEDAK